MAISHVIRGQEFLASTPNYLNLYEALEFEKPVLATMPHILGPDGKKKLNRLVDSAKEYAGGSKRSTLGTALHSFCEAVDIGRPVSVVPEPFDKDVAAYVAAMEGIQVSANYVEKIGVVRSLGVAGTMDRVVKLPNRELPLIADLKTGKELEYSWQKIAIQLALYAHSDSIYDPVAAEHRKMLKVDQQRALVIHLPAGEGRCGLFLIDIAAGWQMAQICGAVREYRDRKDLARAI